MVIDGETLNEFAVYDAEMEDQVRVLNGRTEAAEGNVALLEDLLRKADNLIHVLRDENERRGAKLAEFMTAAENTTDSMSAADQKVRNVELRKQLASAQFKEEQQAIELAELKQEQKGMQLELQRLRAENALLRLSNASSPTSPPAEAQEPLASPPQLVQGAGAPPPVTMFDKVLTMCRELNEPIEDLTLFAGLAAAEQKAYGEASATGSAAARVATLYEALIGDSFAVVGPQRYLAAAPRDVALDADAERDDSAPSMAAKGKAPSGRSARAKNRERTAAARGAARKVPVVEVACK